MLGSLFSDYSWIEVWGPFHLAAIILLGYFYNRQLIKSKYRTTKKQAARFYIALLLTYIALGSPLSIIAKYYLVSAHMLQLVILFFVVAPLLIRSLPFDFLRGFFWHYRRKQGMHLFGHPWVNLVVFNGLLTIYFIPGVFNTLQEIPFLFYLAQAVLVVNAFLMWWVILAPLPELSKLSYLMRIGYAFFAAMMLMPIGFFLIVIMQAHYPVYENVAGEVIPALTAIYDQQLAGGVLKVFQLTSFLIAIFHILRQWGEEEEEKEGEVGDKNIRVVQGIPIRVNPKKK